MGETGKLDGEAVAVTQFRYYPYVMAAFVAILLLSNIIGASKPSYVTLPGGTRWAFGAGGRQQEPWRHGYATADGLVKDWRARQDSNLQLQA